MEIKKSTIYKRLFATYMIVTIFLIGTLDFYFINRFFKNNIDRSTYINEKVSYDVNEEINKINNSSNKIIENMYSDISVLEDILLFMNLDKVSYLRTKLDKFSENNSYYYNGIERFVNLSFGLNDSLEEISFISYDRMEKNSFNRKNQIKTEHVEQSEFLSENSFNNVSTNKNTIEFVRDIKNPINLKSQGIIIIKYNLNHVNDVFKKYENKHQIIIVDRNGYVIHSSDKDYNYEKYRYYDEILNSNKEAKLEKNYYINKTINPLGIISVAKIGKSEVNKVSIGLINSIVFVDALVLIISLSIIYIKLKLLSDRTDKVLVAMDEVKNGNLEVQIPITSDNDEINYISENFNKMCKDLDEYIKKIYLSEIEQKKAEMTALQNQINPHFLYNTLESIRMKAICNGDKEVGKMLYTLSFLFRKQVKDSNIITLKEELDYCTKYIEIFKFRYYDNFNFEISCPSDLEKYKINKFTIQPLIENYFVHGIRLEDCDNLLKIEVYKEENDILIKIIDNGKGITRTALEIINYKLIQREKLGNSIGISNVNERIVNEYGENYGVRLKQNKDRGVTLIIKISCKEV
ncbi:sensor histidine kinase [Clostridium sartagoforme]|uniref:sensor histidine kinase n=1 Tax=Clostridium sartagoforme TaxID=84031 RepID=UPI0031E2F2FD